MSSVYGFTILQIIKFLDPIECCRLQLVSRSQTYYLFSPFQWSGNTRLSSSGTYVIQRRGIPFQHADKMSSKSKGKGKKKKKTPQSDPPRVEEAMEDMSEIMEDTEGDFSRTFVCLP